MTRILKKKVFAWWGCIESLLQNVMSYKEKMMIVIWSDTRFREWKRCGSGRSRERERGRQKSKFVGHCLFSFLNSQLITNYYNWLTVKFSSLNLSFFLSLSLVSITPLFFMLTTQVPDSLLLIRYNLYPNYSLSLPSISFFLFSNSARFLIPSFFLSPSSVIITVSSNHPFTCFRFTGSSSLTCNSC